MIKTKNAYDEETKKLVERKNQPLLTQKNKYFIHDCIRVTTFKYAHVKLKEPFNPAQVKN